MMLPTLDLVRHGVYIICCSVMFLSANVGCQNAQRVAPKVISVVQRNIDEAQKAVAAANTLEDLARARAQLSQAQQEVDQVLKGLHGGASPPDSAAVEALKRSLARTEEELSRRQLSLNQASPAIPENLPLPRGSGPPPDLYSPEIPTPRAAPLPLRTELPRLFADAIDDTEQYLGALSPDDRAILRDLFDDVLCLNAETLLTGEFPTRDDYEDLLFDYGVARVLPVWRFVETAKAIEEFADEVISGDSPTELRLKFELLKRCDLT